MRSTEGEAAAQTGGDEEAEGVVEGAEKAVRLSPYVQVWSVIAVWTVSGLAVLLVFALNDRMGTGLLVVIGMLIVVQLLGSRIRCLRCREVVAYRGKWGPGPWYGPPIRPICAKCGYSLLNKD